MIYLNKMLICDQHGMLQLLIFMINCSKEKVKNVYWRRSVRSGFHLAFIVLLLLGFAMTCPR
jgi:hypothetical protein